MRSLLVWTAVGVGAFGGAVAAIQAQSHEVASSRRQALVRDLEQAVAQDPDSDEHRRRLEALLSPRMSLSEAAGANAQPAARGVIGPDVIVGDLYEVRRHGRNSTLQIAGFTIGTISCNIGDDVVQWDVDTPNHPAILQNMYRLKDGRFEQVGLSWLKHGFVTFAESFCSECQDPMDARVLGVGCSDPYSSLTNAFQSQLGPRQDLNASTGALPSAWAEPEGLQTIRGKIQVHEEDLHPPSNEGARYFVEGHYITADDTLAGNGLNNVSHREIAIVWTGGSSTTYNLAFVEDTSTQQMQPAIMAWQAADPGVQLTNVDIPEDGRLILGCRATDNGDGTWRYEYAVYNMNSHRSAGAFSVPIPDGVEVTNVGFHDVDYHSLDANNGPEYSTNDWPASLMRGETGQLRWATDDFFVNATANAIRYSTLYNFRFDADRGPEPADVTIGLFRPAAIGMPTEMVVTAVAPSSTPPCLADLTGDGQVNSSDLGVLLASWGGSGAADITDDGIVNSSDLGTLLASWGPCS